MQGRRATVAILVGSIIVGRAGVHAEHCGNGGFELRHIGSTTLQIALAWAPQTAATSYVLERSLTPAFDSFDTYVLSSATNAYGDTGKLPSDPLRFHAPSGLSADTSYYYRVRALMMSGTARLSECESAQLAHGPVRGVAGDLWADVVLGQPDFGQNSFNHTSAATAEWMGGVLVDRISSPNRVFLGDANHNRLLGFDHLGRCAAGFTVNLAAGRAYTTSELPDPTYPDDGGELTDGHEARPFQQGAGDSIAYHDLAQTTPLDVVIDLGEAVRFNAIRLNSGAGTESYTARRLEVAVANEPGSFPANPLAQTVNTERAANLILLFDEVTARYLRLRVFPRTGEPECAACDWLFLGEIRVALMTGAALDDVLNKKPCTADSDCAAPAECALDAEITPRIVIGQPSFSDRSACNHDGTGQQYPSRAPASNASLCLIHPEQISIGETVFAAPMAIDQAGTLFVADGFNHRVLRYEDPFATDQIADAVYGQADFAGNECNRGDAPSCNSLCFIGARAEHGGLAIDDEGNLWVADSVNARVLRFPRRASGEIAPTADVVLGQPDCTTVSTGDGARPTNKFGHPLAIAFDASTQTLYVADTLSPTGNSRLLAFHKGTGFVTGMSATSVLTTSFHCDVDHDDTRPMHLAVDSTRGGLWVANNCFFTELFDLSAGDWDSSTRVRVEQADGLDVDAGGTLYVVGKWHALYRVKDVMLETVFPPNANPVTAQSARWSQGVARHTDQLFVADYHRLLIWNDFDADRAVNHEAADDVYGEVDFTTASFQFYWSYPQVHAGKLFVQRRSAQAGVSEVQEFALPLTNCIGGECTPVRTIGLSGLAQGGFEGYAVVAGGQIAAALADHLDFAMGAGGDEIWVADRNSNRVFRIANLNGGRDTSGPYVDVVLGQPDLTSISCHQGGEEPSARTLCLPYDVALDRAGNLYVADNGGETGTTHRLLEFDASLFPAAKPARAVFAPPASRVFGTGGRFDIAGPASASDPFISPFKPVISSDGYLVVGNNPYADANPGGGQRFPVVYSNPLREPLPQLILGDFTSYPSGSHSFDADGNLYFQDSNWSRLLIYRRPFAQLAFAASSPSCPGDCDENGRVTIDELVRGVRIALDQLRTNACAAFDADNDQAVTVAELIGGVNRALHGCIQP